MFALLIISGAVGYVAGMVTGKDNGKRIFNESLANVQKKELGSWEENGKSVVIRKGISNPQSPSNLNSEYTQLLKSLNNL